ncbi:LOW QUALITY PROTEIN: hypothetical protein M514_01093 [Trichuris suis]|uniref:NADH dehydrogenase [ubiquinone] 1 beta subcomplex subunit 9 n=1 Tax=Trichuris suis TaxID=68888 RepID=A0A085MZD0_9BILA|nr:LOW QUALITY PROTEIN: hypothetical protein M513_01093 [Trichuris suis]KFD62576.1 LOW QUALITY PROTEIN: hypothetical protein M514_01093 [Trichuris suis]
MQAVKVEQLKQRLLSALDEEKQHASKVPDRPPWRTSNNNTPTGLRRVADAPFRHLQVTNVKAAGDAILLIERTTLTKESLEESRLGLLINEVRRKNQSHFPDFAKRCRALIKEWQKLISSSPADQRPQQRRRQEQQRQQPNYQHDGDPVKQYPVNNCHAGEPLQAVANDKQKGNNANLVSPTAPPLVDVALTLAAVAPVEEDSNALDEPSQLKIRIKFGRSDEASIVRTVDQTPVNRSRDQTDLVGIEQAENRRKRKHAVGGELLPPSAATAPPGVLSLTSANGEVTPKTNGNLNASGENSPTSSAFGMASEETDGGGGIQAAAASRLPKLKSTAALVAEMTKSYPDTVAVHIDDGAAPAGDDHSPMETRSLASSTATTGLRGRHATDRRGQETTDFEMMGTAAADVDARRQSELTITKCAMLQRFLDNIDSQVASPPFIHDQPPSMLPEPVIDGWSKSNGDDGSSAAPSTSTSPSSSPSANVSVAREPLSTGGGSPTVAEQGTFDLCSDAVDWQAMLPPIDELKALLDEADNDVQGPLERDDSANRWLRHRLRKEVVQWHLLDDYSKEMSDEQRRFRADNDPTTSSAVRELRLSLEEPLSRCDRFIALHSRVLTTLRNGRQVLAMPYVDIGIPDFLEYGLRDADKFVVSRSEAMDSPLWYFSKALSHRQKVCRLYKAALRLCDSYFRPDVFETRFNKVMIRARFDQHKDEKDPVKKQQLLLDGLRELWEKRHPTPFACAAKGNAYDPYGCAYGRLPEPPDSVLDISWEHPEREQYPYYFARREQRKKEVMEQWEKIRDSWRNRPL